MEWVNYHHLLYFWVVAREGSIVRASELLRLAQPTISGQLKTLEDSLGEKLFSRAGRRLVLTEFGRVVYRYADEIFGLGREMMDVLKGRSPGRPMKLVVGASDFLPKTVVYRLLEPAMSIPEPVHIVVHEAHPERLLAALAAHDLDVVLTDSPPGSGARVKAFHHLLGSCGVSLFASPPLAARLRRKFPQSLDGEPFLLPIEASTLRRGLDHWFDTHGIRPRVVGEFQDLALAKAFGQAGKGVFAVPSVVEDEVRRNYGVGVVGRTGEVMERYYAVSLERKFKHPAVLAVLEAAREKLFAGAGNPPHKDT